MPVGAGVPHDIERVSVRLALARLRPANGDALAALQAARMTEAEAVAELVAESAHPSPYGDLLDRNVRDPRHRPQPYSQRGRNSCPGSGGADALTNEDEIVIPRKI